MMTTGDVVWPVIGAIGLVFELIALRAGGEHTLTRVSRRWPGIQPHRPWRIVTTPLVWIGLIWLAAHLTT